MSITASGLAGQLGSHELETGRASLDRARDGLRAAVQLLSEDQWHFAPTPECWTIAGVVEHIVVVQELVLGPVQMQLAGAPPLPEARDPKVVESIIINQFPDRSQRFPAPDPARPTGRWTPAESLERYKANDQKLRDMLESTPGLRDHAILARPLQAITKGEHTLMDGYEWILAAAGHTERHTLQILEYKAAPNYPPA